MDRTLVGDLEQFGTLLPFKLADDRDLPLDPIEHALFRLTFGAVVGVDPRVAEANGHARERPPLPSRIQRDGHGGSGAERRQQEVVRSRPAVGPTRGHGLVGDQPVASGGDLLDESFRASTHRDYALFGSLNHGPPPFVNEWADACPNLHLGVYSMGKPLPLDHVP